MKSKTLVINLLIGAAIFIGCKKSSNSTPSSPLLSKWIINNTTYIGRSTYFDSTLNELYCEDSFDNFMFLWFKTIPPANGNYSPIRYFSIQYADQMTSSQCGLYIGSSNAVNWSYASNGINGTVSVTTAGGKVHASFSNIGVSNLS